MLDVVAMLWLMCTLRMQLQTGCVSTHHSSDGVLSLPRITFCRPGASIKRPINSGQQAASTCLLRKIPSISKALQSQDKNRALLESRAKIGPKLGNVSQGRNKHSHLRRLTIDAEILERQDRIYDSPSSTSRMLSRR